MITSRLGQGDDRREQFIYLADQSELLPILADWFFDEWGLHDPESSREHMRTELGDFLYHDRLPLTIVLLRDSEPIASASLKIKEMETHPQYLHWLGGVYVHPDNRGQGVGSRLVEYTAQEAIRFNVTDLFLYTHSHEKFYARLGWRVIEEPIYKGRVVSIMKRKLTIATLKE